MSSDKSLNLSVYASDVLRLNVAIPTHMYKWSPKVLTLWGARSYTLAFSSSIYKCSKGLLLFSHLVMSDSLWPHGLQVSMSFTISRSLLKLMSIESVMPPTISSSIVPFSSCLQSFPASGSFPMSQLFTSGGPSIGVSTSTSVLPINIQGWFQDGLVWSPCSPMDSQESSPTPQLKGINSLALSLFQGLLIL